MQSQTTLILAKIENSSVQRLVSPFKTFCFQFPFPVRSALHISSFKNCLSAGGNYSDDTEEREPEGGIVCRSLVSANCPHIDYTNLQSLAIMDKSRLFYIPLQSYLDLIWVNWISRLISICPALTSSHILTCHTSHYWRMERIQVSNISRLTTFCSAHPLETDWPPLQETRESLSCKQQSVSGQQQKIQTLPRMNSLALLTPC